MPNTYVVYSPKEKEEVIKRIESNGIRSLCAHKNTCSANKSCKEILSTNLDVKQELFKKCKEYHIHLTVWEASK